MKNHNQLILKTFAAFMVCMTSSQAEVSVFWDFSPGNEHGWTTVNGVSSISADGVEAGQANGDGIVSYFGGVNNSGGTRRAHDGAHTNFIYRSPVLNFGAAGATGPVLEMDWFGGQGNQSGTDDPGNPDVILNEGAGKTSDSGQKGLALLNLATGSYDAVYYDSENGGGIESISLTQADLVADGISLSDNYQLDFFDTDDGGWGWTRLEEVRLDDAALTDAPTFNISWDFNDNLGGDRNWKVENGFAGYAEDGVHAALEANDFAEDAAHPVFLFRSPMVRFDGSDPDLVAIEVDFIGGQGNQGGAAAPANPETVTSYNGGSSNAGGQKGLAFLNLTTGVYDHVIYDSEDGGEDPESMTFTHAELETAGIDFGEDYRLDFFDYDDGSAGWTRLESVNINGLVIPDPLPPSDADIVWDFSVGNEHGWTTVNGVSWVGADGVEAGQADGAGIADYFGGVNDTGDTRRAHDGAHANFIYRSPVLNFASVSSTGSVLEMDWFGGQGNQNGSPDPVNPAGVGLGGTVTTDAGSKGLAFLNLSTGDYDAVYYDPTNGNGVESISLTLADLTGAGVSLFDDYQLDFFENDDGGWGWTRLDEIRIGSAALGGGTKVIESTEIEYSPGDQMVTLTWNSREGVVYAIKYSEDMIDWSSDLDDFVAADVGDKTTRSFDLTNVAVADRQRLFFRVEEQP